MITVNKANPTAAEERTSLVNASDGGGLNLVNGGKVELANSAAAEFGTSDFSLEFVLNQTGDNVSDNYIYFTHGSGNNRLYIYNDISADVIKLNFEDSGGSLTVKTLSYDMSADYGTPTHYAMTFDRDADATLYKNGNSVASVDISAASSIDIGDGNTGAGQFGSSASYGVLGTFYRFRAFNTLADAKLLFERADVPQTLTANLLFDLDLAFANPTQSLTVQDRSTNGVDGTASSSTEVKQVQPVVQLNSTSARIGTFAATPANGQILVDGQSASAPSYSFGHTTATGMYSPGANQIRFSTASTDRLTINSTGLASFSNGVTVSGGFLSLDTPTELTIASGAVTVTKSFHDIDTEGDAATDDLDTINGGSAGDILTLKTVTGSRDVTVKDATGNLRLAGDFTLTSPNDTITLIKYSTVWIETSRSDNV